MNDSLVTTLLIVVLFALLVVYVGALGPLIMLCGERRCRRIEPALETIYAPLAWAHRHTALHDPLEWWVDRWRH